MNTVFLKVLIIFQTFIKAENSKCALEQPIKALSDNLERWNNLYSSLIESRFVSTTTLLTNINTNVNNLQERAHVWDTFQLHIAAWNDQLATLDRKIDIISKGQEKILDIESKLQILTNLESKIDNAEKNLNSFREEIYQLKERKENETICKIHNILFRDFTAGGILNTIKTIEKKIDWLIEPKQNGIIYHKKRDRQKLTIKCNTPRFVEDLLKDISSKVDIIYDKVSEKDNLEFEKDYLSDFANTEETQQFNNILNKIYKTVSGTEIDSKEILEKQNLTLQKVTQIADKCEKNLDNYFTEYKNYIRTVLTEFNNKTSIENDDEVISALNLKGCEDLDSNSKNGVYIFLNETENTENHLYNKKYCFLRNNQFWTVIQRRGYYSRQNFNMSWSDYKNGFGNMHKDFWFGNEHIHKISQENNLILRIELEDFSKNYVWAEYEIFQVLGENNKYQLMIGKYSGNATDSFSSHNGSYFSTYDRKNDGAPDCCPCAISYGGGWWFNSCFESNLNGVYHNKEDYNGYYQGLIWEKWLGNYSLKKSLMMVKVVNKLSSTTTTVFPYYEDP